MPILQRDLVREKTSFPCWISLLVSQNILPVVKSWIFLWSMITALLKSLFGWSNLPDEHNYRSSIMFYPNWFCHDDCIYILVVPTAGNIWFRHKMVFPVYWKTVICRGLSSVSHSFTFVCIAIRHSQFHHDCLISHSRCPQNPSNVPLQYIFSYCWWNPLTIQ